MIFLSKLKCLATILPHSTPTTSPFSPLTLILTTIFTPKNVVGCHCCCHHLPLMQSPLKHNPHIKAQNLQKRRLNSRTKNLESCRGVATLNSSLLQPCIFINQSRICFWLYCVCASTSVVYCSPMVDLRFVDGECDRGLNVEVVVDLSCVEADVFNCLHGQ